MPKPRRRSILESPVDYDTLLQGGTNYTPSPSKKAMAAIANTILGVLPGSGDAMAVKESQLFGQNMSQAFKKGDYGKAASSGLQSLLAGVGALPLVGTVARGVRASGKTMGQFADALIAELKKRGYAAKLNKSAGTFSSYVHVKPKNANAARDLVTARISDHSSTTGDFQFLIDSNGQIQADPATAAHDMIRLIESER